MEARRLDFLENQLHDSPHAAVTDAPNTLIFMVCPLLDPEGMSWNCSSLLVSANTSLEQFSISTQSVTITLFLRPLPPLAVCRPDTGHASSSHATNPCWNWREGDHTPTDASWATANGEEREDRPAYSSLHVKHKLHSYMVW